MLNLINHLSHNKDYYYTNYTETKNNPQNFNVKEIYVNFLHFIATDCFIFSYFEDTKSIYKKHIYFH